MTAGSLRIAAGGLSAMSSPWLRLPSVSALIACWRGTAPMVSNLSEAAQPAAGEAGRVGEPAGDPVCYANRP